MKRKYLFSLVAAVASIFMIASCSNSFSTISDGADGGIKSIPRALDEAYLGEQGYMGGAVLYNPSNPNKGHLAKDAVVAFRLGKVEEKIIDGKSVFVDIESKEALGYITVKDINKEKISFAYVIKDVKAGECTLKVGESADLDGDGINDVAYVLPETERPAFKGAVYLKFLSSRETKNTTMFAVLKEQYAGETYPSGLIGINETGNFLYTKYTDNAASARAAITGAAADDFVLDIEKGCYVRLDAAPASNRAVSDDDLKKSHEVALNEAVELAQFKAKQDKAAVRRALAKEVVKIARSNKEFLENKDRIIKEFSEYTNLIKLKPVEDYVEKLNEYSNVKIDAQMGLYGKFVLTWDHIECDLMSGAYLDGRFDLTLKRAFEENLAKYEKELEYKTQFNIGPVPIKLECPIKLSVPLKAKISVDSADMVAKFTGLYGAGVDIDTYIHWNKIFTKDVINLTVDPYAVSDGVFFLGVENDDLEAASKKGLELSLTVEPEVCVKPNINIVAVEAGLVCNYKMIAGLSADAYANFNLTGKAFLKHEGKVDLTGGFKLGPLEKKGVTKLFDFNKPLVEETYTVSMKDVVKNMKF